MRSRVGRQPTGQSSAVPGGLNIINQLQVQGEDEDEGEATDEG